MPHDLNLDLVTNPIDKLVDFCKSKAWPLVIGCDANSHHFAWDSSDTNGRGEKLFD
mgnify:CR=1 FL=1